MIGLSLNVSMPVSLSFLDSGGSGAMTVKRLLAFVGVGLIVIGALAAAVAVSGSSPRVSVARIGMGTSSRIHNGAPGKGELDRYGPYVGDTLSLSGMSRIAGNVFAWNGLGQVVGDTTTASGAEHAVLWQNGAMTDLGTLGGGFSVAEGTNRSGAVVGLSTTSSQTTHAFLWQNGVMTDLGTLGGTASIAYGINNLGQVVGVSITSTGAFHAFLWQNGAMTDLGTLPGAALSPASGSNDHGHASGTST